MKIITVGASASKSGKTTLVRNLAKALLPDRVACIKLGHGKESAIRTEQLFHGMDECIRHINELAKKGETDYLIVESSSICNHINYDLSIFIADETKPFKNGAEKAIQKADIIIQPEFDKIIADRILFTKLGDTRISDVISEQAKFCRHFCTKSQGVNPQKK
ncbi:MAG: hypothetical protein HQM10_12520 [Candidatus Riflebacteria bacterium]|nr:hypothetical protein [Candidatus Riflebacteria bacterium]